MKHPSSPESAFVTLIKATLERNGFVCRGNVCKPRSVGELSIEIAFRNRWGVPLHDVCLLVKTKDGDWLLTDDLYFLFPGFANIFANFNLDEMRDLKYSAREKISSFFSEQIAPEILTWIHIDTFLAAVSLGRFDGRGLLAPAVERLKGNVAS